MKNTWPVSTTESFATNHTHTTVSNTMRILPTLRRASLLLVCCTDALVALIDSATVSENKQKKLVTSKAHNTAVMRSLAATVVSLCYSSEWHNCMYLFNPERIHSENDGGSITGAPPPLATTTSMANRCTRFLWSCRSSSYCDYLFRRAHTVSVINGDRILYTMYTRCNLYILNQVCLSSCHFEWVLVLCIDSRRRSVCMRSMTLAARERHGM